MYENKKKNWKKLLKSSMACTFCGSTLDFFFKNNFRTKIDIEIPSVILYKHAFSHAMYKLHFFTQKTWLPPKKKQDKKKSKISNDHQVYFFKTVDYFDDFGHQGRY